jgi:hypothetical protein
MRRLYKEGAPVTIEEERFKRRLAAFKELLEKGSCTCPTCGQKVR